jgi:hypothetical protein
MGEFDRGRGGGQSQQGGEAEETSESGGALRELVRRAQAGDPQAAAQLKLALARRRARNVAGGSGAQASPAPAAVGNDQAEPHDAAAPAADGRASKPANDTPSAAPTKTPEEELAAYGLTVDDFKDYCRHHTQRGWDGSQAAGLVDMILISRKVEKIPDDVRRRLKHALFHQGDQTLVMEEIGGAAVIGTRQDNAERRADEAARMERETLANMTGGVFGAVAGGVQQWLTPDDRAKIHAASGVGAGIDNIILSLGMKGEGPQFESPREFATYEHGAPTRAEREPVQPGHEAHVRTRPGPIERVPQRGDGEREYQYNQLEPGPLSDAKYGKPSPAQGFYGGKYNATVLEEDKVFYRVGNATSAWGQWFTEQPIQSEAHYRIDLAVKREWSNPATGEVEGTRSEKELELWCYTIMIPRGTTVYEGQVGSQGDVFMGGLDPSAKQFFIPKAWTLEKQGAKVLAKAPFKRDGHVQPGPHQLEPGYAHHATPTKREQEK